MIRLVVALALATLLALPARAGLEEGLAAYRDGDFGAAFRELEPLAQRGEPEAQHMLGRMYRDGEGVLRDYRLAEAWYRRAAEQGKAESQNALAKLYEDRAAGDKDDAKAVLWYRKAAEQGLAEAQYNLGLAYAEGRGVDEDAAEAARWWRMAAEQGLVEAQNRMGRAHYAGRGVPEDRAAAVSWWRKAAEQGSAEAQDSLGRMYENGFAVAQDYGSAAEWYGKAAAQDLAEAQFDMGRLHHQGLGVEQSHVEAAKWYRKAAEQGHATAQTRLGALYVLGQGVPKNFVQAYMWLSRAAGQGEATAVKTRKALAKAMTPAQIAKAQRETRFPSRTAKAGDRRSAAAAAKAARARFEKRGIGSGIVVSREGHVLTNQHVVAGCGEVRIPPDGVVEFVGYDADYDLAVLQMPTGRDSFASFSTGPPIRAGDTVVAAGYPLQGLLSSELHITTGSVSALAGPRNDEGFLQVTVPVQPGNSGGPLLDLAGNVVGVVVAKLNAILVAAITGDIPQNVNFAINAEVAKSLLETQGIAFEAGDSGTRLSAADVGELARGFTVLIECWK